MPITNITPLPSPPSRSDPVNFAERADDFLGALPTFVTQLNTAADEIEIAESTALAATDVAVASASTATGASATAEAAANYVGRWADLSGPLNIPASTYHNGNFWILLNYVANVAVQEPGVSPSWAISPGSLTPAVETLTTSGSVVTLSNIPSAWNEIHLHFKGVIHTGILNIRIGDLSGFNGWVYDSVSSAVTSAGALGIGNSTADIVVRSGGAGTAVSGVITLRRVLLAEWCFEGILSGTGTDVRTIWVGGRTRASNNTSVLNSLRLTATGAFTAGSVLIRGRV